jgi:hypothetical protein
MCLLRKSQQMAQRAVHESRLYDPWLSHMVTCTYADEFLPKYGVLVPKHAQDFIKRVRFHREPDVIRYMLRGEYGEQKGRPHFHFLFFNLRLDDLKIYSGKPGQSDALWVSPWLQDVWGMGTVKVAPVNASTAQYTAAYLDKLILSPRDAGAVDLSTGEIVPPFNRYSTRPGLGAGYYDRYGDELWAHDSMVVDGAIVGLPRYYDKLMERDDPAGFAVLKAARLARAMEPAALAKGAPERVAARIEIVRARLGNAKRGRGIV